jgi:hypothetical protein
MKFYLLSSVCGAALLVAASPASAGQQFSGVVQLNVGAGTTDSSFITSTIGLLADGQLDDPLFVEGKAKGIWPLSDQIHLQADVFAEHIDNVVKDAAKEAGSTYGAAIHLLHPFEDRGRFGVAASIWDNDTFFSGKSSRDSATYGLVAVEGQFFGSDWTVTGQAGIMNQLQCGSICSGTLDHGNYLRGKVRYFLHDNTSVSLSTTQLWGTLNDDDDVFGGKSVTSNYSQWMLEAEHRFADSPFSGTFAVSHERNEVDLLETSADTSAVWLGLRFYLDQPTLKAHDRSGAELDTPTFGNALENEAVISGAGAPLPPIPVTGAES